MRTRGADEDLVVVDLDDPDEVESRGPGDQRRHFEDHYAELPFGLGTVARRLEPDPWYLRPGVLLWIVIALVGLLALAASDDDNPAAERPEPEPTFPVLTDKTGVDLLFTHLNVTSMFDVDAGTFQVVAPWQLADRPVGRPDLTVEAAPPDARGRRPLVVAGPSGPVHVADGAFALAVNATSVVWRPNRCEGCPVRITDARTGRTTTLARTRGGTPRDVALAPDATAVALLDYAAPGRLLLRVLRASGRTVTRIELGFDVAPMVWSRNSRWLFVVSGATLLAIDGASGETSRVGNTLPPFEALAAY